MRAVAGRSWRWLCVGAATLALCLVPAALAALQAGGPTTRPDVLLRMVLASADRPYQGYVESRSMLGVPDLPALGQVSALASGTATTRAWYASPLAWRVAVVDPTGEVDLYRTRQATYTWDFARNSLTQTVGQPPVRLPDAADLLPPELARRLLSDAAHGTVTALPGRHVAGISAAGLGLTPTDPDTAVGRVEVWADPVSGLPLQVEVRARSGDQPLITSRFLEVSQARPEAAVLTPARPASAGFTTATGSGLFSALPTVTGPPLPDRLAGRTRAPVPPGTPPIAAAYGTGLAMFAVIRLPRGYGGRTLDTIRSAGGSPVAITSARGYLASSPLMSLLAVQATGQRPRRAFLLAGLVDPALLRQAAAELMTPAPAA